MRDGLADVVEGELGDSELATIDALARALARNPANAPFARETVPPAIRRLVESLDHPAYVTGRRWDVLAWNTAATELFVDFGGLAEEDRNILVYLLLDPAARRLFGDGWADRAQHVVAQFHAAHDLWAPDPAFTHLSTRLRAGCPEFDAWWTQHEVLGGGAGAKVIHHPAEGTLHFEYTTFQANENPALRLTIYTPTDSP